jgi:hypothetical protein
VTPAEVASPGSRTRQLVGKSPDWLTARQASAAASRVGKRADAEAFHRTRSCTRIHASVTIPSEPSEPRNSRSGDGPAPEPGSRRDSLIPVGVTTRIDSTRSSMCVYTVAKCPPERVANHPPRVENSNDCGKWRRV